MTMPCTKPSHKTRFFTFFLFLFFSHPLFPLPLFSLPPFSLRIFSVPLVSVPPSLSCTISPALAFSSLVRFDAKVISKMGVLQLLFLNKPSFFSRLMAISSFLLWTPIFMSGNRQMFSEQCWFSLQRCSRKNYMFSNLQLNVAGAIFVDDHPDLPLLVAISKLERQP